MRLLYLPLLAGILGSGVAIADVTYQIDADNLASVYEPKDSEPITIKDRVWAAPGVEQSMRELDPPMTFDFANSKRHQRTRIERTNTCGWIEGGGPEWLDDAAWPRTRELFGLGQLREYDNRTEFSFGLITLQR